jgi:hypothetical protein
MTKKACEWIEFDHKNYILTQQELMKKQETAQQLQQQDQKIRELYSRETLTFKGTREQALEAIKFKI